MASMRNVRARRWIYVHFIHWKMITQNNHSRIVHSSRPLTNEELRCIIVMLAGEFDWWDRRQKKDISINAHICWELRQQIRLYSIPPTQNWNNKKPTALSCVGRWIAGLLDIDHIDGNCQHLSRPRNAAKRYHAMTITKKKSNIWLELIFVDAEWRRLKSTVAILDYFVQTNGGGYMNTKNVQSK